MLDDIHSRTGQLPVTLMADANHAAHKCIDDATERGVEVLIPVPKREKESKRPVSDAVAAWKLRMETPEAKRAFRARPGLCELGNAHVKARGLAPFVVRGITRVTNVALIAAISHNILQHIGNLLG